MGGEVENVYENLSVEFTLLLSCLIPKSVKKEQHEIEYLLGQPINWDVFLHLALYHGVYPLVYQYLKNIKHVKLPAEVSAILLKHNKSNTSKTLQMTGELVTILRDMDENGIAVVVMKGFPLGYKLYGNMALRPSHDLDILIWPEDVDKVRMMIEKQGYDRIYPSFDASPGQIRDWMKIQHHFIYWHNEKQIMLEIHWQLGHHGMDIPLTYLENNLSQVKIAGQTICMLGTECLLLFLVLHGASHKWCKLKWLCDIAMMLRQEKFSWNKLYTLAEHLRVKPILNQAIVLSRNLLGASVPDNIVEVVNRDSKAQKLANMAMPFIINIDANNELNNDMRSYYHQQKYGLYLQSGWRRKFGFIYDHFLPTDMDIEFIELPKYLYFLYFIIRPFTWFKRQLAEIGEK